MTPIPTLTLTFFLLVAGLAEAATAATADRSEIFYADPTIYVENNKYYLTGTRNSEPPGFALLESTDLKEWRSPTADAVCMILRQGDGAFGTRKFWAPQILKVGADYFHTYSADEHVVLAKARSLLGPYRQDSLQPIDGSEKNIDSYVFRDDDGRYYLYHVRFARGNYLWVAEFDLSAGKIKRETLSRCFGRTEAWEATPAYQSVPIMEGPTVLKMRGRYYLFYSANHYRSVDYAMGYAVADSPLGPWVKHPKNPVLHRSIVRENGSGHGDMFQGLDGKLYYVYHVHHSDSVVLPRRTRIAPLILTWNEKASLYDLRVDVGNIIVPRTPAGMIAH